MTTQRAHPRFQTIQCVFNMSCKSHAEYVKLSKRYFYTFLLRRGQGRGAEGALVRATDDVKRV